MEQNINDALEVYVDRPLGVFVDKLEKNLSNINQRFLTIRDIFHSHKIMHFEKLPDGREDRNMFAKCFSEMTHLLEAAKLQGFVWEKSEYEFQHGNTYTKVKMELDERLIRFCCSAIVNSLKEVAKVATQRKHGNTPLTPILRRRVREPSMQTTSTRNFRSSSRTSIRKVREAK